MVAPAPAAPVVTTATTAVMSAVPQPIVSVLTTPEVVATTVQEHPATTVIPMLITMVMHPPVPVAPATSVRVPGPA